MQAFTVSYFERLTVNYSALFYSRSLTDGPKNFAYWMSMFFFVLTLIIMGGSVGGLAFGRGPNTHLGLISVALEFSGLGVWVVFYEPVYRYEKLKRSGLNVPEGLFHKKDREIVKSIWLKKYLSVSPDKYLELAKKLYEIREMIVESKKNRQLGDRFLSGFFSLKPLQSVLS